MPHPETPPPPAPAAGPPKKRPNWVLWIGVAAVALILAWPAISGYLHPIPPDNIPWRTSLDAALAEAKRTGQPVLIDFTASWCPPCQAMKRDTWPDARLQSSLAEKAVPVLIDIDQQPSVAQKYAIEAVPTLLKLDASGKELRREVGYRPPDAILEMLK